MHSEVSAAADGLLESSAGYWKAKPREQPSVAGCKRQVDGHGRRTTVRMRPVHVKYDYFKSKRYHGRARVQALTRPSVSRRGCRQLRLRQCSPERLKRGQRPAGGRRRRQAVAGVRMWHVMDISGQAWALLHGDLTGVRCAATSRFDGGGGHPCAGHPYARAAADTNATLRFCARARMRNGWRWQPRSAATNSQLSALLHSSMHPLHTTPPPPYTPRCSTAPRTRFTPPTILYERARVHYEAPEAIDKRKSA
jgi:hypothetical protein